jgi:predicted amidophosphoribosyltransferase
MEAGDPGVLDLDRLVPGPLIHRACLMGLERAQPAAARPRPLTAGVPIRWVFRDGPDFFRVLHAAKYQGRPGLLAVLGEALAAAAGRAAWIPPESVLVPLPDDRGRRRQRGYSVTGLLAAAVRHQCGGTLRPDLLVRRRDQPAAQASLEDPEERAKNVRSLFGVGRLAEVARHRPLVLVEDQVTTGSTLRAALGCLGARGHAILGLALGGSRDAPTRVVRP